MSGIQAVGARPIPEAWAQYPAEQQHLYDVIPRERRAWSGDPERVIRHYAEISRRDVGLGYPLYDFTASALNAANSYVPTPNDYRDGATAATQRHNFGVPDDRLGTASGSVDRRDRRRRDGRHAHDEEPVAGASGRLVSAGAGGGS
jgi:hypothetical protein